MKRFLIVLMCTVTVMSGLFLMTACGNTDTRKAISVEGNYETIDKTEAAEKLAALDPKIEGNFEAKSRSSYNPYYQEEFVLTCVAEYSDGKMQMSGSDAKKVVTSYSDGIYSYEIFPYGDPMEIKKIRQDVKPGYFNSMLGYFPVNIADELSGLCESATEIGIIEDGEITKLKFIFDGNFDDYNNGMMGDATICLVFVGGYFNNSTVDYFFEGYDSLFPSAEITSEMYPTDKKVTVPDDLDSYEIT